LIAIETLFRTSDGFICKEGDPRAAFLLCRAGTEIEPEIEAMIAKGKMVAAPPENKAVEWPAEAKRMRTYKGKKA
jgi:hypothetical protein